MVDGIRLIIAYIIILHLKWESFAFMLVSTLTEKRRDLLFADEKDQGSESDHASRCHVHDGNSSITLSVVIDIYRALLMSIKLKSYLVQLGEDIV